jgi:hypothetical protein
MIDFEKKCEASMYNPILFCIAWEGGKVDMNKSTICKNLIKKSSNASPAYI